MEHRESNWSELLQQAVSQPGKLLKAFSAFHGYSIGNQLTALVQCESRGIDPGPINTYPGWQALGRQVRKGEKALTLCQPLIYNNKQNPDESYVRFVYKPRWFVLSQTDGEPIEPPPTPEWNYERALTVLGITEQPFDTLNGNVQGYARERSIHISPLAQLPHKTRFHELAHVMLGHTAEGQLTDEEHTPKSLREAEAESVALICCESLEIPGSEYARGYIQNWLQGSTIPEQSAQKIFGVADRILKAGRPEEAKEDTQ